MDERPIWVVSGTPRSGTSLMMQLLAAAGIPLLCDDQRKPDASNPRGYFELEAVKATRSDPGWLAGAPGHAVKVVHALLGDLPTDRRYRVLFLERDAAEVVASQNRMLERLGEPEVRVSEARLVEIQRRQVERARALLDAASHFEWRAVSHRALVRDPRRTLAALEPFFGRSLQAAELESVVDPSLHRERGSPAPHSGPSRPAE